jgi:uncharacterized protein (DUF302 family)
MAGTTDGTPEGIVTKRSVHGVDETIERLTTALNARSVKIFAVIDHRAEAAQVGLTMPDTKVIIFGNPRAGTPIMQASPPAALDLPLRVLVASDGGDTVVVRYTDPRWLASRYGFDRELAANLTVIDALTDAASRPDPDPAEQLNPAKEQQHHD